MGKRLGVAQPTVSSWLRGANISMKNTKKIDELFNKVCAIKTNTIDLNSPTISIAKHNDVNEISIDEEIELLQKRIEELKRKRFEFTEDEKVILRNLPERFKFIARDENGGVFVYEEEPHKDIRYWTGKEKIIDFEFYEHLFPTLKWEDKSPCEFRKFI